VAGWASELGEKGREEVAERLLKATKSIRAAREDLVKAVEAKLEPPEPVQAPAPKFSASIHRKRALRGATPRPEPSREPAAAMVPPHALDTLSPAFVGTR
jgi:hypothetical protein